MNSNCQKNREIDLIISQQTEIRKDVKCILQRVSRLEVKSGVWGFFGGMLPTLAALLFFILQKKSGF